MKACANEDCIRYGVRFYDFPFCKACGKELKEIETCCPQESIEDEGFCVFCGKRKELKWKK